jgi:hypothetical protein
LNFILGFINTKDIEKSEVHLQSRFNNAPKLKGIQKLHSFHVDHNVITAHVHSLHTAPVIFGNVDSEHSSAVKLCDLKVSEFVEFDYDGSIYCGEITLVHDRENIKINAMEPAGKNQWRWPQVKDEIFYSINSIIRLLPKPLLRTARGQYSFV